MTASQDTGARPFKHTDSSGSSQMPPTIADKVCVHFRCAIEMNQSSRDLRCASDVLLLDEHEAGDPHDRYHDRDALLEQHTVGHLVGGWGKG